jgi:hypothetical protein
LVQWHLHLRLHLAARILELHPISAAPTTKEPTTLMPTLITPQNPTTLMPTLLTAHHSKPNNFCTNDQRANNTNANWYALHSKSNDCSVNYQ